VPGSRPLPYGRGSVGNHRVDGGSDLVKIVVCVKQVPARDSVIRASTAGGWIETEDLTLEMNEPDAYALEEALRVKEEHGGEVLAVSAGPESASSTLREALAKGADRALLIEDERFARADPLTTARALAAALKDESPDLILTGLQSDDTGFGQTGVVLAELLGLPAATIIMEVALADGRLRLKRELESGWFQRVEMPLPALLTIQSGINKPRYATLMGIKRSKKKPFDRKTAGDLGIGLDQAVELRRLYVPEKEKQTQFLSGSAREQAAQLIEKLRFEARVL